MFYLVIIAYFIDLLLGFVLKQQNKKFDLILATNYITITSTILIIQILFTI